MLIPESEGAFIVNRKIQRGRVKVDLSNQSATVWPRGGGSPYTYAPGVTRRNVEQAIGKDGWCLDENSDWELMNPPDGFERDVEKDEQD